MRSPPFTLRAVIATALLVAVACTAEDIDDEIFGSGAVPSMSFTETDGSDEMGLDQMAAGRSERHSGAVNAFGDAISADLDKEELDLDSHKSILSAATHQWSEKKHMSVEDLDVTSPMAPKKAEDKTVTPQMAIQLKAKQAQNAFARAASKAKAMPKYVVAQKRLLDRPGYTWQCVKYAPGYWKAKKGRKAMAAPAVLLQQENPSWAKDEDQSQMEFLNQQEASLREDMQAETRMLQALSSTNQHGPDYDPAGVDMVQKQAMKAHKSKKSKFQTVLWAVDHKTSQVYTTSATNPFPASPFFSEKDSLKSWKKDTTAPKLAQVSSEGSDVWGVSPSGKVHHRTAAGKWETIQGRRMRRVSVATQHVWAVDPNDNIFVRNGAHGAWTEVAGKLRLVEASGDDVWGLNKLGAIYYRHGLSGQWQLVPGGLKSLSVSGKHVWGLDKQGNVFHRNGIKGAWERVAGSHLKHISVNDHGVVYGVNTQNEVLVREGGKWKHHLAGVDGAELQITSSVMSVEPKHVSADDADLSETDEDRRKRRRRSRRKRRRRSRGKKKKGKKKKGKKKRHVVEWHKEVFNKLTKGANKSLPKKLRMKAGRKLGGINKSAGEMRYKAREARILAIDIMQEKKAKMRAKNLGRGVHERRAKRAAEIKLKRIHVTRRMRGKEARLKKAAKVAMKREKKAKKAKKEKLAKRKRKKAQMDRRKAKAVAKKLRQRKIRERRNKRKAERTRKAIKRNQSKKKELMRKKQAALKRMNKRQAREKRAKYRRDKKRLAREARKQRERRNKKAKEVRKKRFSERKSKAARLKRGQAKVKELMRKRSAAIKKRRKLQAAERRKKANKKRKSDKKLSNRLRKQRKAERLTKRGIKSTREIKTKAGEERKAKSKAQELTKKVAAARRALHLKNGKFTSKKGKAYAMRGKAREARSKITSRGKKWKWNGKGNKEDWKAMEMRHKAREARNKLAMAKAKKAGKKWKPMKYHDDREFDFGLVKRERAAKKKAGQCAKKVRQDVRGGWRERRGKRARARKLLHSKVNGAKKKANELARKVNRFNYQSNASRLRAVERRGKRKMSAAKEFSAKSLKYRKMASEKKSKQARAKKQVKRVMMRVKEVRSKQAKGRGNEKTAKRAKESTYKSRRLARQVQNKKERARKQKARARGLMYQKRKVAARRARAMAERLEKKAAKDAQREVRAKKTAKRLRGIANGNRAGRLRRLNRELSGKKNRERRAKKYKWKKRSLRLLKKIQVAVVAVARAKGPSKKTRRDRNCAKTWERKAKELSVKVRAMKARFNKKQFVNRNIKAKYCLTWAWVKISDWKPKKPKVPKKPRWSGPKRAKNVPMKKIVSRILRVELTTTLVRNVMHLKAYCLGAHRKMASMKRSSQLTALGSFLYQFGKKKSTNSVGEYIGMYRSYMKFYSIGIDHYLISRLHDALSNKSGILTARLVTTRHKAKPSMMLKHRTLGLQSLPSMFKKVALPVPKYQKNLRTVRKTNKVTVASAQFEADGCRCTGRKTKSRNPFIRKLGKTCKKWFSYDKKPWCFVNPGCHGAVHAQNGGQFRYC